MNTTNDAAIAAYCGHMAQIDHIARHLADYSDDHGWLSPDAIDWTHVATAGEIVALLTAACNRAGIDLTTDPDYFEPPAFAQPSMFPAGEDTPLFTQPDAPAEPGKRIELTYRALSVSSVDVCMDCIAYATPPGTVAGCWAHLEKMRERGEIPQTQYDEIRRMADFIEAD